MKKQIELQAHHLTDQRRKLDDEQVKEILSMKGAISAIKLAKNYNVSRQKIYHIWFPEYKEKNRINSLTRSNSNTPEQKYNKLKKQRDIKKLINQGLM
jgi:microsomal dipeptidase-like Zn-dependent dipeptidase